VLVIVNQFRFEDEDNNEYEYEDDLRILTNL
jgi:hypothetical protein